MRPRAVAIIDGEHYPPVVREALGALSAEYDIVAAAFAGGVEKLGSAGGDAAYGLPLVTGRDAHAALTAALREHTPDMVLDLSDEPVVTAADRMALASTALSLGAGYRGADFAFSPPPRWVATRTPVIAIIGTGKRVGKTAVSAFVARYLKDTDRDVVVLAMGRGGPAEPEIIHGEEIALTAEDLVALARRGVHAASDNYEDALMSRVTTVGCRRCGGGLAGATFTSNVPEGAMLADALGKDVLIAEGSGSAIPPVAADATLVVVGAGRGAGYLRDFFGPYRMALADALVIAGAEEPIASPAELDELVELVGRMRPGLPVSLVTFRPRPLADVAGARAFFATTAPPGLLPVLTRHLEQEYGCEVVASSPHLSDRVRLREDMSRAEGTFDLLLTELKAAAVDVVAASGADAGVPTVFCDNEPVPAGGASLSTVIERLMSLSIRRHEVRS
ncbi:MAG: 2,3-diphosphoglycerate synthetase [Coriobacteriia bacterium]